MKRSAFIGILILTLACRQPVPGNERQKVIDYREVSWSALFGVADFNDHSSLFVLSGKDTLWVMDSREVPEDGLPLVLLSCVFAGFTDALDANHRVVGIDMASYYSDSLIQERVRKGEIRQTGEEMQLDHETLLSLSPAVVVGSSHLYGDKALRNRLENSGIKVLMCDNFREQHPLARAEWIKFFGFLCNRYPQADSLFRVVEQNYLRLAGDLKPQKDRPMVLTDALYMDVWNVPGGRSYTAKLISDAGGNYVFADKDEHFTYPLSLENVLRSAAGADIWIHVNRYRSKEEMLKDDPRYTMFRPFRENKIFNNNRLERPGGANEFWESGVVRPDLVLADLTAIFSGEEIPADKLRFYARVN